MGKMNQAEKRGTKANELWTHFLSLECIAYVCLYSLDVRDKYACMKKAVLPSSSEMIETPQPKNTALLHRYLGWLWRISLLKSTQKKQVIFCLGLPRSRPGKKCQHNIREKSFAESLCLLGFISKEGLVASGSTYCIPGRLAEMGCGENLWCGKAS